MRGVRSVRRTGGQIVGATLADMGVGLVLSLPGSQVLPIWDGLDVVDVVVPRTERHAAFMAEGYARAARVPAVLMSTLGPGVANELVGLRSARRSRTPVVCVAPWQPPWKRPRIPEVFQGLDQPAFFADVCKAGWVVDDASEIPNALEAAFAAATAEPAGPVRVDVAFPLLFRRHRHSGTGRCRQVSPKSGSEAIRVRETGDSEDVWAPGIDRPGFALPFALGVKLAHPNARVTVETTPEWVTANLGVLVLADSLGVGDLSGGAALNVVLADLADGEGQ